MHSKLDGFTAANVNVNVNVKRLFEVQILSRTRFATNKIIRRDECIGHTYYT